MLINTVFQRCVNYALQKVCFHNTPWCVNLHTPKTHLIMCYFKDKRCVGRTHHGVFWEHTCFYSVTPPPPPPVLIVYHYMCEQLNFTQEWVLLPSFCHHVKNVGTARRENVCWTKQETRDEWAFYKIAEVVAPNAVLKFSDLLEGDNT